MKLFSSKSNIWMAALIFMLTAVSCKDVSDSQDMSRMFRPTTFRPSVNINTVNLTWVAMAGATYLLELSRDSLEFVNDLQSVVLGETSEYTFTDLWSRTRYSARIKSVSHIPGKSDSEFKTLTFVTGTENIFITDEIEVFPDAVTLSWDRNKKVDHIVVSAAGQNDVSVDIPDAERASGKKTITGLASNQSYKFLIYLGEQLRGSTSAKTLMLPVNEVQDIEVSPVLPLFAGKEMALTATPIPADAEDWDPVWSIEEGSANIEIIPNVATKGTVTVKGLATGAAVVKVKSGSVEKLIPVDIIAAEETPATEKWECIDGASNETFKNPGRAFDGNVNTYCETGTTADHIFPFYFTVDMHGYKNISGFVFTPRVDNISRNPKKMVFETSMDGQTWTQVLVVEGEVPRGTANVLASYVLPMENDVIARYFRITFLSHWASATVYGICFGEVTIYSGNPPVIP